MADSESAVEFAPADLAPGDGKSLGLDRTGLEVKRIHSPRDPLFTRAYEWLWNEFGAQHEMESRDVIERRLAWQPVTKIGPCWLRYEMMAVQRNDELVAVRDHTAVVTCEGGRPQAIVHLSHVLVEPSWRRTGLAGWLRAWPVQTARAGLAAAGLPTSSAITLVAEMEHPDADFPNRSIRLKAYEKAGFKKVDSTQVEYFQPDFRSPAEIDAGGGPRPLPFSLVLRRVGREDEPVIRGAEVRALVSSLYRMYETGFREQDMAAAWQTLSRYPADDAAIPLLSPAS